MPRKMLSPCPLVPDKLIFLPVSGDRTVNQMVQAARSGKQNLLAQLPDTFTRQDAVNVRQQAGKDSEGTGNMLSQWLHRGYILRMTDDSFKKASAEEKKDWTSDKSKWKHPCSMCCTGGS